MSVNLVLACVITGQLFGRALHYGDWLLFATGILCCMLALIIFKEEGHR